MCTTSFFGGNLFIKRCDLSESTQYFTKLIKHTWSILVSVQPWRNIWKQLSVFFKNSRHKNLFYLSANIIICICIQTLLNLEVCCLKFKWMDQKLLCLLLITPSESSLRSMFLITRVGKILTKQNVITSQQGCQMVDRICKYLQTFLWQPKPDITNHLRPWLRWYKQDSCIYSKP